MTVDDFSQEISVMVFFDVHAASEDSMNTLRANREILDLPLSHPAQQFLRAFVECRRQCVGREASDNPIDQEWYSECDRKKWLYSKFAYKYLSFDIVLDGWLTHAPPRTDNEGHWLTQLPRWRKLMRECWSAAEKDKNKAIMPIIARVLAMFDLWEQCILARDTATIQDYPPRVTRDLYPAQPDEE